MNYMMNNNFYKGWWPFMNNITFGQYLPGNTWIYKLDPRTKVLLSVLLIVIIFLVPTLIGMAITFLVFVLIFLSTRISILKVLKGLKPIIFLLLFTFVLQLIYNTTGELLYVFELQIGLYQFLIMFGILVFYILSKKYIKFKMTYMLLMLVGIFLILWLVKFDAFTWASFNFSIYDSGLQKSLFIFLRIIIMIGITSLLTLSTMSMDINNGLEWVLSPLKYIKVPVSVISMTISLTLRFIPTLLEESKKIMNAQASRGVDFSEGKLKDKITQIISLLVPMFVISFRRAEDLSNAMETRGYVIGAPRTKIDELKFKTLDIFCFVMCFLFLGLAIGSNFIG